MGYQRAASDASASTQELAPHSRVRSKFERNLSEDKKDANGDRTSASVRAAVSSNRHLFRALTKLTQYSDVLMQLRVLLNRKAEVDQRYVPEGFAKNLDQELVKRSVTCI